MMTAHPIRAGAALSLSVGIGYTACTLVFWLWPDTATYFMNALFHGLDFRKLQSGSTPFNVSSFLYAIVTLTVWTFVLGAIYSWVLRRFDNVR